MKKFLAFLLILSFVNIILAAEEGLDLNEMMQDSIGASEGASIEDTFKKLEGKKEKTENNSERKKKAVQKK